MPNNLLDKHINKRITIRLSGRDGNATLTHNITTGLYALMEIVWADSPTPQAEPIILTTDMANSTQEIGGTLVLIHPPTGGAQTD